MAKKSNAADTLLNFVDSVGENENKFTKKTGNLFDPAIGDFIDALRHNLETIKHGKYRGHMASGQLWQAIGADGKGGFGFVVKIMGQRARLTMTLPDYYDYTDEGRSKTSSGGSGQVTKKLSGLQGWISKKGLVPSSGLEFKFNRNGKTYTRKLNKAQANKTLAFLISRKIHKFGYKGSGWFSKELQGFINELNRAAEIEWGKAIEFKIDTFNGSYNK